MQRKAIVTTLINGLLGYARALCAQVIFEGKSFLQAAWQLINTNYFSV